MTWLPKSVIGSLRSWVASGTPRLRQHDIYRTCAQRGGAVNVVFELPILASVSQALAAARGAGGRERYVD